MLIIPRISCWILKLEKNEKKNYFQITWETWERLFMSMCARVWIKQIWIWGHHLASDLYINNQQHLASLLWNEIICSRRLFGLVWFCFWTPFFNNTNHQTLINISLMGNWIFVFFSCKFQFARKLQQIGKSKKVMMVIKVFLVR